VKAELNPPPDNASFDRQAVTQLLQQIGNGSKEAVDQLVPLVYDRLRSLASRCMLSERAGHTLRATALVHEAYLRLVDASVAWQDRAHFYSVAARVMRHILVDHAKAQKRQKRGGNIEHIALDEAVAIGPEAPSGLLELDDALQLLAVHDARKSQIVELLFFGGLTYDETAFVLGVSPATIHRELKMAKAWLYRELSHRSS
jgi:RNA polymerase sigma factor (TIGR02999 family)